MDINLKAEELNRTFILSGEIDDDKVDGIARSILECIDKDNESSYEINKLKSLIDGEIKYKRKPINLYIQSPGGSLYACLFLYDILINSSTDIYTYCTGAAMSAGFILFLAGKKRFISENATLLLHQPYIYRMGKYKDIVEERTEDDWMMERINSIVLNRTDIKKKELKEMIDLKKDLYYHHDEALKKKIATHSLSKCK